MLSRVDPADISPQDRAHTSRRIADSRRVAPSGRVDVEGVGDADGTPGRSPRPIANPFAPQNHKFPKFPFARFALDTFRPFSKK